MSKLIDYDLALITRCHGIIGVDEVGRGPLAGPIVVAACYLNAKIIEANRALLEEADDSKKLSEARITALGAKLADHASIPIVVVQASPQMVERLNPLQATLACWKSAVSALVYHHAGLILVDGSQMWQGSDIPLRAVVKGDATSCAIAVASIVAKANRDAQMRAYDTQFPKYGFAGHKGYGTAEHNKAILLHGPCPIHRLNFSVEGRKISDIAKDF